MNGCPVHWLYKAQNSKIHWNTIYSGMSIEDYSKLSNPTPMFTCEDHPKDHFDPSPNEELASVRAGTSQTFPVYIEHNSNEHLSTSWIGVTFQKR